MNKILFVTLLIFSSIIISSGQTPNCTNYCATIMANCNGTYAQYTDAGQCNLTCNAFPVGTIGDVAGNTLGCRSYHASVAPTNVSYHCPHAGPTGGNVCGSICEAYCNISLTACTGATNGFFADYPTCYKTCINYNSTGFYTYTGGSGANVECKVYHATAALADPTTHCPHCSPSGNGVCGSKCDNYCYTMGVTCPTQAAGALPCAGFCSPMPPGNITDVSGDTVDCRIYHANNANITGDATHCLHATPSGGGVCGTPCNVYCGLALSVCTGSLALYNSTATCQTACAGLNATGLPGAVSGDTLQCRIYHLGAASATGNTSYHCPHGGVNSATCGGSSSSTSSSTSSSSSSSGTGSSTTGGIESLIASLILLVTVLLF